MAREVDPLIGFQFALEVNNMTGYFTEVTGISSDNAVATHKVVSPDGKEVTLQVPGRCDGGEMTFKRGLTTNVEFWEWREKVVTGHVAEARVDGSVIMFNREYQEVRRWNFINAWPSKISGPVIAADSNDLTIEELTIVHEGLYLDAPGIGAPTREPPF
ncbi:MAG TPA: phage tail protein [Caldilineaceae bacterium]|nr:phage tail protein [Caldilineaceae bacterium]